jgi:hypothetical protein
MKGTTEGPGATLASKSSDERKCAEDGNSLGTGSGASHAPRAPVRGGCLGFPGTSPGAASGSPCPNSYPAAYARFPTARRGSDVRGSSSNRPAPWARRGDSTRRWGAPPNAPKDGLCGRLAVRQTSTNSHRGYPTAGDAVADPAGRASSWGA